MSNYKWFLVANEEQTNITVVKDGRIYQADQDSHSNIDQIIRAALDEDPDITDLFDVREAIKHSYKRLSERITVVDDEIRLDGDPAPEAISQAILTHLEDGTEEALVNFLEKLANNPSKTSIEQVYPWLDATGGFTITEDGDLVAYKGVTTNSNGEYVSVNHGRAIVDGVEHVGPIPNHIGAVVEMPRSEVVDNSAVGCAQGLHAGTFAYARGWAQGALLEVRINPRDIVSVPSDCGAQKIRTCRYTVTDIIDEEHRAGVLGYTSNPRANWRDEFSWGDDEVADEQEEAYDNNGTPLEVGDEVVWHANRDNTWATVYIISEIPGNGLVRLVGRSDGYQYGSYTARNYVLI